MFKIYLVLIEEKWFLLNQNIMLWIFYYNSYRQTNQNEIHGHIFTISGEIEFRDYDSFEIDSFFSRNKIPWE